MPKATVRRSACDQCRVKRVRCFRAENSTEECARCSHIGERCVTGASGRPGRPPKSRLVNGATNLSSPGLEQHRALAMRDVDHVEAHVPAITEELASAGEAVRAPRSRAEELNIRDGPEGVVRWELGGSMSAVHPSLTSHLMADRSQPDFWELPDDGSALFNSPLIEQSPALSSTPNYIILNLVDQPSSPSQLQLGKDDPLKAMLHIDRGPEIALDIEVDQHLEPWDGFPPTNLLSQYFSPASSLMQFREGIDQQIAVVEAYFSDPLKAVQGCKEGGANRETENPAALLLTYCKELIDIIQCLTPTGQMHVQSEYTPGTDIILLALSSYLSFMRLFDSIFYTMYKLICQMPPASFKAIQVKSVLRIGGIPSLQDMPLKMYAIGILDTIRGQMRTLERCMGIPAEYCLSGEAASPIAATPGLLASVDRRQLFGVVMAQEDVKSRRGCKSYVESIRASIQDSMEFLDD